MSAPMQTLDVASFPLHGSRLIEAAAGTGKTWTIAALYVRLVLGHGGGAAFTRELDPPEILVVTFTEAATRELRNRIRMRLTEAARVFEDDALEADEFLTTLRAGYSPAELPGRARRLRMAAEWMDEAAVSTIHAWCRRMLSEHAFDSGSPFSLVLDTDPGELLAEAVRDCWRSFMVPLAPAAVAEVRGWWPSPDQLGKALRGVLPHVGLLPPAPEPAVAIESALAERNRVLAELKAPWGEWVGELQAIFDAARADKTLNGNVLKKTSSEAWLANLRDWQADPDAVWPDLTKSAWERFTPEGLAKAWKNGVVPEHPALVALVELSDTLAALPDAHADVLRHAAHWVAERFDAEKRRRARMGFDDLLERLATALRGPNGERLAARIRSKFPVALIDEFQDTDPVQYAVFDRVYRVSEDAIDRALVLIGDPKQAIYAFRGADIHTYLVARRACAGRLYTLNRNHRSTRAMVAAVNQCFGFADRHARGAFRFGGGAESPVPFHPADVVGREEVFECDEAEVPALTAWWLPLDEGGKAASKADDHADMAASCASTIRALLAAGREGRAGFRADDGFTPLRPEHIAVLVNTGTEAATLRRALAARGVRSVYLSGRDSVFASAQAAEVQCWLEACAEPDEPRRVRTALATATLGLDWSALDALDHDERAWEDCVLRFRGYREVWREQGVLPMLRRLLHDHHAPARLLSDAGVVDGGERVLTDLLHLAELLQQASQMVEGEHALIRHLATEREDAAGGTGDETRQMRLESDADLVKVVTVHKSKGLQYPLVFVPFACSARKVEKKDVPHVWHDGDALRLSLTDNDDARKSADAERLAEDVRKLYVALTRARYATWLGVAPARVINESALGHMLGGAVGVAEVAARLEAMRGDCADIAVELAPTPDHIVLPPEAAPVLAAVARSPQVRPRERWWIASYSALRKAGAAPETPAEDVFREAMAERPSPSVVRSEPDTIHAFHRGAAPGTFLHGLLEWAAGEGFAGAAADRTLLRDQIARRAAARGWERWIEPLTDWMQRMLVTPLPLPGGGAVAHAEMGAISAEMEFWLAADRVDTHSLDRLVCAHTLDTAPRPVLEPTQLSGMLKGFIDLVFEHEGRYYVIDYKSNWLGATDAAYTPEAMRTAILEARYELQYVLYLFALHRQLRARLPGYDYDRHIGGAAYVFLRGIDAESRGVHVERPPRELIEALDELFSRETAT